MIEEIFLALVISFDTFLAAAAYRSGKIRIPLFSGIIIAAFSSASLGISLLLSELFSRIISTEICRIGGFIILSAIGIITIFKSLIRTLVRKLSCRGELLLRPGTSGIVVKLYLDDTAADFDSSKTLSPAEAAALALAGSLDSVSTGLSCGFNGVNPGISAVFAFLAAVAALILGSFAGSRISNSKHDLSWLGGAALMAFAIFQFIKK